MTLGLFSHFKLYKFLLTKRGKPEKKKIELYTDDIISLIPLNEALYTGPKDRDVIDDNNSDTSN
jgi:hypothetical protein